MKFRKASKSEEVLKHETRRALYETLTKSPGLGVGNLGKILNVNRGTVSHHLTVLQRSGLVESQRVSKYTLYFAQPISGRPKNGTPAPRPKAVAAIRRRGALDIVRLVRERSGVIQKELAEATGMSRKVLRDLLDVMVTTDLLNERRVSRTCEYFPTPQLEDLLTYIEPSLKARDDDNAGSVSHVTTQSPPGPSITSDQAGGIVSRFDKEKTRVYDVGEQLTKETVAAGT